MRGSVEDVYAICPLFAFDFVDVYARWIRNSVIVD